MKSLRHIIIVTCMIFSCVQMFGQDFYNGMHEYYSHKPISYDSDAPERTGPEKQHDRIYDTWAPRLYPHGDIGIAAQAIIEYANSFNAATSGNCENYSNYFWEPLGPFGNHLSMEGIETSQSGNGQIHRITYHPEYDGVENKIVFACSFYGGLWKSEDRGFSWNVMSTDHALPMTTVSGVVIDHQNPSNMFISTGNGDQAVDYIQTYNTGTTNPVHTLGVYRSSDSGETWEPINNGLINNFLTGGTIRKIEIDPSNGNNIYLATSKGVFHTANGLSPNPIWQVGYGIPTADNELRGLEIKPNNSAIIYASGKDIYKSTNNGTDWVSMTGQTTGLDLANLAVNFEVKRINIAVGPDMPERVYAVIFGHSYESDGEIDDHQYIYYFDGSIWHEADHDEFGLMSPEWIPIAVNPANGNHVIFGNSLVRQSLNIETDDFNSISRYSNVSAGPDPLEDGFHPDVHELKFEPIDIPEYMICGNHGGVSLREAVHPYSKEWTFGNEGLQVGIPWTFDFMEGSDEFVALGHQDCAVSLGMKNSNGTYTFSIFGSSDGYGCGFAFDENENPNLFYKAGGHKRLNLSDFTSNNFTHPYDAVYSEEYGGTDSEWRARLPNTFKVKQDPNSSNYIFGISELWERNTPASSFDIYLSDIGKYDDVLWHTNRQIMDFEIAESNTDVVYILTMGNPQIVGQSPGDYRPGHLYKSTDGFNYGVWGDPNVHQFEDITFQITGNSVEEPLAITDVEINPNNHNDVWVTISGYFGEVKVLRTLDGGTTWYNEDPDETLPNLPVNGIVYQKGTNNRVYIGTDAGVYFKDDGMTCWEKLGKLPNTRVIELDINYCNNKLLAATFGRGLWQTEVLPYTQDLPYIVISDDTDWNENRILSENIKILDGATLTVTSQLKMPEKGKIVVEPGGTLVVDGGHITNECSSFWLGIDIHGIATEHQYIEGGEYHQGRAIFKNGAIIENARDAVQNWEPQNWSSTGGIIQAENTQFINCRRVGVFMNYQNYAPTNSSLKRPDASYFQLCEFILNDDYAEDMNEFIPEARFTLWGTDRVMFRGCKFENQSTTPTTSEARAKGIRAHDSSVDIREYCPSQSGYGNCPNQVKNHFTGWFRAIEGLESSSSKPISVRQSIFSANMQSVYIAGADYSRIYDNTFSLGEHPFTIFQGAEDGGSETNVGVFSDGTTHFSILNNMFSSVNQTINTHGVLIKNSGGNDNVVYNNTFQFLTEGANAWQVNRNSLPVKDYGAGEIGLQFKCNAHAGNQTDFRVMRTNNGVAGSYVNSSIRTNQGEPYAPNGGAGNVFTVGGNPDLNEYGHWDADITNGLMIAYYESSTLTNNLLSAECTAGDGDFNISNQTALNSCPATKKSSKNSSDFAGKYGELGGLEYTYHQLIDDGNTPGTINEIALTWPEDAWDLRDELMARSPYNSEDVLIAAAEKEIMPHAMLLEVLVANPDALRSGRVIRSVSTDLLDPMPTYMVDLLYVARDESTLRTQMQSQLGKLHTDATVLKNLSVAEEYFSEGDGTLELDSLPFFIEKVKTIKSEISRAGYLAGIQDYTKCQNVLDSLLIQAKLTTFEANEVQSLINFYDLIESAQTQGRNIASLESSEINQMMYIGNDLSSGLAGVKARNLLCFHYDICIPDEPAPKSNSQPTSNRQKPSKDEVLKRIYSVKAFPNPGKDFVTIEYTLLNARENTILNVYNSEGKKFGSHTLGENYVGQKLIDTRTYPPGLYIYEIVQDNEQVSTGKFSVVD